MEREVIAGIVISQAIKHGSAGVHREEKEAKQSRQGQRAEIRRVEKP